MRLKRHIFIQENPVKLYADPIFLHFAIASLIFAIIGAVGAILSEGFQKSRQKSNISSSICKPISQYIVVSKYFSAERIHRVGV